MSLEYFVVSQSEEVFKNMRTCHKDTGFSLKALPLAKSGTLQVLQ